MPINQLLIRSSIAFIGGIFLGNFFFENQLSVNIPFTGLFLLITLFICSIPFIRKRNSPKYIFLEYISLMYYIALGVTLFLIKSQKSENIIDSKELIAECISPFRDTKKSKMGVLCVTHKLCEGRFIPIIETKATIFLSKDCTNEVKKGDKILIKNPRILAQSTNFTKVSQIYYTLFTKSENILILSQGKIGIFEMYFESIKKFCVNALSRLLKNEKVLAVVSSLTLGNRDFMIEEVRSSYSETGTIHVLAVSGLHVGVFYLLTQNILTFFFFFLRDLHPLKDILSMLILWFFAAISGFSPSVIRATTMFSTISLGKISRRRINIYDSLAISSFIILFFNPRMILDLGFQLSYSAVLGIAMLGKMFIRFFSYKNVFLNKIWEMVSISTAAQVGTMPIILFFFGNFPLYFLLGNLVIVPLASFVLYGGLFTIFFSKIPLLSKIFPLATSFLVEFMNYFVSLLKTFPYHLIPLKITFLEMILLYSMILSFIFFMQHKTFFFLNLLFFIISLVCVLQIL